MYLINLTYKVPLDKIDEHLPGHVKYLTEQYELGNFLVSGRKKPRTGGIILSKISDRNEMTDIINRDPFKINDLADYELVEFIPTKTCRELDFLKG